VRNLGRRDPGVYPLLVKCSECGHRQPENPLRPDLIAHWPWCSRSEISDWQDRYNPPERVRELRARRHIERFEPDA
jgi:hypothetical protein